MKLLRLEELESRHLFSGGFFAPQHFGPPPGMGGHEPGPGPAMLGEPPPPADLGGGSPVNWGGPTIGLAPQPFDDEQVVIVMVIVEQIPVTAHSPDLPNMPPAAPANPKPGATDVGSNSAIAEPATTHSTAAAKTNSQTPVALIAVGNVPTPAVEVQGPSAAQLPIRALRPGETVLVPGGALPFPVAGPTGMATPTVVNDNEPAEAIPVPPSAVPSLLSALPSVDLPAFGRGLRRFLGELERTGEELVANGDALRPWLIAAAAGATACEIARRQWARNQRSYATGSRPTISLSDL